MKERFFDFEIVVGSPIDGSHSLRVESDLGRESRGTLRLPFTRKDLEEALEAGEITPTEVGHRLYEALFPGEIDTHLERALEHCKEAKAVLRVKLRLDGFDETMIEMASLPWELACRPEYPIPLALRPEVAFVRYLEGDRSVAPLPFPKTLRVLAVIASPNDQPAFDKDKAKQLIRRGLGDRRVEIHFLDPPTLQELRDKVTRETWHIIHFTGHGALIDDEWCLTFEQEDRTSDFVSGRDLAITLGGNTEALRLVNLVGCKTSRAEQQIDFNPFNGVAQTLVHQGIPAVIGMQFAISVEGAFAYAETLYNRIAAGEPVLTALDEARYTLYNRMRRHVEWATPVLFMRTPTGELFGPPKQQVVHLESVHRLSSGKRNQLIGEGKHLLDFTGYFEGDEQRVSTIRDPDNWQRRILAELTDLKRELDPDWDVHFHGKAWGSIWLATGMVFCQTAGFTLAYSQLNLATGAEEMWRTDGAPEQAALEIDLEGGDDDGSDLVISIEVSRTIKPAVTSFLERNRERIAYKKWLNLRPAMDTDNERIANGAEALGVAVAMARKIRENVDRFQPRRLHILGAAPAGLYLLLGHHLTAMPDTQLYEWTKGDYEPACLIRG